MSEAQHPGHALPAASEETGFPPPAFRQGGKAGSPAGDESTTSWHHSIYRGIVPA